MNTTLSHTLTHPPDTEDRTVRFPAPDELRALSAADRLSLRIGLWLLQRTQRPRRRRREWRSVSGPLLLSDQHLTPRESAIVLSYHLQRQMH
ncbi:hypothetical protein [Microbacterium sp. 179-I 3D4 NHS]|uniref:hypothetical protein n=1 Tax=Microbacterium sp. 179-I 3D4 NHS TaxID=3142381 RepID=UPI0039A243C8